MNSPVLPSSPVCEETNFRSSFSSSPTSCHRTRTRSIGAVAIKKIKSVAKLANATLTKINGKKQKSPPVPKLPPMLPIPVAISAKPFMSFCPETEGYGSFEKPFPCLLALAAQEELLESSSHSHSSSDTRAHHPNELYPTPTAFGSPRSGPGPAYPPSHMWSSPTSSAGCSARSHTAGPRDTASPLSSLQSEGSAHRRFVGMDRPFVFPALRNPYIDAGASISSSSFSSYYSSSSPRSKVHRLPPPRKSSRHALDTLH